MDGLKLAQLLVGAGCDVNQCALGHRWQGTALHMAVENNCYKMVQFLLSAGADPDITGRYGTDPDITGRYLHHELVLTPISQINTALT